MNTITLVLIIAVGLLYLKWILIALTYPLMAFDGLYRNRPSLVTNILRLPFAVINRITRGGWSKYLLTNLSMIPNIHFRKALYKGLGAHIEKNVVFHFKTEIRTPYLLSVGGVRL